MANVLHPSAEDCPTTFFFHWPLLQKKVEFQAQKFPLVSVKAMSYIPMRSEVARHKPNIAVT
jgi:hypothetical protein